jgi:hypothetical protein
MEQTHRGKRHDDTYQKSNNLSTDGADNASM